MTILKARVRISDNVLEDSEWPVAELTIRNLTIIQQEEALPGVYSFPDMVGWSLDKLGEWLGYDPTGEHPEVYHELDINGEWKGGRSALHDAICG